MEKDNQKTLEDMKKKLDDVIISLESKLKNTKALRKILDSLFS